MSLVTTLWSMDAAAALTLAILCGLVWAADRRNLANLMLCLVAVAVAAMARTEVGMMHATAAFEYEEWARWCCLPAFVAIVGQLLFVHYYLRTSRRWLLWIAIIGSFAVFAGTFLVSAPFNWRPIADSRHAFFLGERVAIPDGAAMQPLHWLTVASCLVVIGFVVDAAVRSAAKGNAAARQRALVAIGGVGIPLTTAIVMAELVVLGVADQPLLLTPAFLITIVVMALELSRRVIFSRRAEQELEELRGELARVGRLTALGQLASALAHELSQPLGAILRNAEAAELHLNRAAPDVAELRAIVTDVRNDARRAGDVIDQMRALIKRRTLAMHPLALKELVQDVFALLHADALARHVALDCAIAPELPLVAGDRVHLSQVLLNLVMNSMDAIQASSVDPKRVVIGARRGAQGKVEVAVTDSGPVVSPELVDKVFDPFFTTKSSGMGMGLSISRTIVEAHGGRLWAEAGAGGRGLTFRFTLSEATVAA
jgi:signal transduction histidine kinase